MLHIALYQPVIPQNVGNIARTCVGMHAALHIIGPTIIDLSAKAVRRAGLDYWDDLTLHMHDTPEAFFAWLAQENKTPWLITKHGEHRFDHAPYQDGDVLLFGSEREGLPDDIHTRFPGRRISIPIPGQVRSYNIGNSVAICLAQANSAADLWPHDWTPRAGEVVRNTIPKKSEI